VFQRIAGTASSVYLAAQVAGSVCSAFIVRPLGTTGSMGATTLFLALQTAAGATFLEPPFMKEARAGETGGTGRHLRESLRLVFGNGQILALVFIQIVLLRSLNLANRPFAQPLLRGFGIDASTISLLFAGFAIVGAAAAKASHPVDRLFGRWEAGSFLLVLLLLLSSLALLAYGRNGIHAVVALAGINLASGLSAPLLATALNRWIGSERRATCLAIANMGDSGLGIAAGPLFGRLGDISLGFGLMIYAWSFGLLAAAAIAVVLAVLRRGRRLLPTVRGPTTI
jgi:hypothetical protein